jgi:hypothetical protein
MNYDKRYDKILASIRVSYPNSCIIEIKEVINEKNIIEKFSESYIKELSIKPETIVMELFHGTDEHSIYNIIKNGFRVSENVISAYGKGSYFSNNANISKQYANKFGIESKRSQKNLLYVIIADVVISDMKLGGYNKDRIPSCWVNSVTHPSYFCIPHDNRALPKYVVSFFESSQ